MQNIQNNKRVFKNASKQNIGKSNLVQLALNSRVENNDSMLLKLKFYSACLEFCLIFSMVEKSM